MRNKYYYSDGSTSNRRDYSKILREGDHAVEYACGPRVWYKNDRLHREDGPAIEFANGNKYWYINGIELSQEEFEEKYLHIDILSIKPLMSSLDHIGVEGV